MLLSKNGVLKICDFGFARLVSASHPDAKFTDYVSTRWYRAPELLVGDANYSGAVDVWAIGCIFVELITGRPLFTGDTDYETLRQVLQTLISEDLPHQLKHAFSINPLFQGAELPLCQELEVDLTIEGKLSFLNCQSSISFARECLRLDPKRRPTCEELMAHEYFNDFREWFEDEIQTLIEYDNQEA
jgi:cyclin-dependent kinase-like